MSTFNTCYNFLACVITKRLCLQAIFLLSAYATFPVAYILKRLQIAKLVRKRQTRSLPGIVHGLPLKWKVYKKKTVYGKDNKIKQKA